MPTMPAKKRAVAETAGSERRRSGRLTSTPKKSSYWEGSDKDTDDESDVPPKKKARRSSGGKTLTEKKAKEIEDEYKAESDAADDDDNDDEVDEEAPMKVQVLPLEQMRGTGGVEYADHKLHKNSLLFLKDLKANNRRPWLKSHDGEFRRAFRDWESFVNVTTTTMTEVDETVPELPSKDIIFRIYRDTRFSKDPTPYKPHFSAAWSRTGRKGPYAVYYIHCQPGNSFIGGGLWQPEAQYVHKMRRSIDRHPERWRELFRNEAFRRVYFPEVKSNASADAAIKAFTQRNQDNALKKRPMGYDATHPDIELLKLKNYTVGAKIDETILCKDDTQQILAEYLGAMEVFITFVNSIIMPDPGLGEDDVSSDDDDDDDEEEGV